MKKILPFPAARLLAIPVVATLLALGGCASPVTYQAMVPVTLKVSQQHPQSVSVAALGGSGTDSMGKSQIDNAELAKAVTEAINQTKTFSRVVPGKGGDYLLTVNIVNVVQPNFGFSFTVGLEMGWTLIRASDSSTVWQEAIKSEHTASATDAFAGTTRLRLATEGAARNNVEQGLRKIAELKL